MSTPFFWSKGKVRSPLQNLLLFYNISIFLASKVLNILLTSMEKYIKGYKVIYEENAKEGVNHLEYVLSYDESHGLFKAARSSGKIPFEDRLGRNYNLVSKLDGSFVVEKRSTGWFWLLEMPLREIAKGNRGIRN